MHDEQHCKNKLCSGHAVSSSLMAARPATVAPRAEPEPSMVQHESNDPRHTEHR